MRTLALLIGLVFLTAGCGKEVVEKPDNLIGEDKMVDIMYDLSVLEAIKSQRPLILENNHVNPSTYIYKKHGIDSLQFAKSNQYYATDLTNYKKLYEQVSKKLKDKKGKSAPANPDAPQVQ